MNSLSESYAKTLDLLRDGQEEEAPMLFKKYFVVTVKKLYSEAAQNGNKPFYREALTRVFVILRDLGVETDETDNDLSKMFS